MRKRRVRTPRLYRVFPWVSRARAGEPGGPLYVSPVQGAGRIDNPERYATLYASDSPAGAVAEAFGNHAIWTPQLLAGPLGVPTSTRALAAFDAGGIDLLDLDDPRELVERRLRPSEVVSRDRARTQAWALRVYEEGRFAGVRWWSRLDPRWGAVGAWDLRSLRVLGVTPLTPEHPALREAASALNRPWTTTHR